MRLKHVRTKLDWADKQSRELGVKFTEAMSSLRPDFTDNPKFIVEKPVGFLDIRHYIAFTVAVTSVGTVSPELGLQVGEVVHHYRGALDYLSWQMVPVRTRGSLNARQLRDIQFPMAQSRQTFNQWIDRRLPDVPRTQRAIVQRYQPYHRTLAGRAMRLLRNLSDIDKHRLLILPIVIPSSANLNFKLTGAEFIHKENLFEGMKEFTKGAELARFVVATEDLNAWSLGFEGELSAEPALPRGIFRPFSGTDFLTVRDVLEEIGLQCRALIDEIDSA